MKFRDQMRILLWKNWTLKKRSPLNTSMEILLPLFIFAILIVLRSNVQPVPNPPKFPPTMALPSAGLLPMVQSFCDGGVHDQEGFRSQPNSFVDTILTLFDGITQLTEGEWPPIPLTDAETQIYHAGPYREGLVRDGHQKTGAGRTTPRQRRSKSRPDGLGAPVDLSSATHFMRSLSTNEMGHWLNWGEHAMKKNVRHGLNVYDQVKKLSTQHAALVNASPYDSTAASNATNTTQHEQCARYGIHMNGSEPGDWFESLTKLWKGTEVFLCMNPTPAGGQRDQLMPSLDSSSFQFGGAGGFNFDNLPIQEMVMRALLNNPTITYSPVGTDADLIIEQVVKFLEIFNDITKLANEWLGASSDIRGSVDPNGTIQADRDEKIKDGTHPGKDDPKPGVPVFNRTTVQEMIISVVDSLDYMTCYWLSLVQGEIDFADVFKGLPSEDALVKYSKEGAAKEGVTVLAGIVFDMGENGSLPNHLTYKIRQNATISPTTRMLTDLVWEPGSDIRGQMYIFNGFVVLQDLLERSAITVMTGETVTEPGIYVQEFPAPCFIRDDIKLVLIEHMFPLGVVLGWVFLISMLVRGIVYEKEQRLKEVMRLMGLRDSVHWLAWFTTYLIEAVISVTLLVTLLNMGSILNYTDPMLLWCIFMIYALNTIFFSCLVSVFFNKAKIASAVAGIAYILTYVPYMIISIFQNAGYPQSVWIKAPCSLFAPTGMGLMASYFNFYETTGHGLTFDNFMDSGSVNDAYNPFLASMMSLLSSLVYVILVWYIDTVFPGEYGLPRPWYFFITPTYWCGRPAMKEEKTCTSKLPSWLRTALVKMGWLSARAVAEDLLREDRPNPSAMNPTYFEEEPRDLKLTLAIKELTKVYSNGKLALDSLTLNMYEGQILSFLGHNGAGKTTTMSILTGMIPASSGTAIINDLDIRSDMHEIRRSLGMCPQHNVLFESLTVDEHLQFYARLKGTPQGGIDLEIENMLDETGLRQKRYSSVFSLSGGMKRKLSIGIAFISGSRAVILDEPTAGVDPWSRRDIWDLILRCKEGRTIMMSTHHMDEADILGDRIAVISHGTLKCVGSSLFLKGTFGEGYHLIVTKKLYPAPLTDLQSVENVLQEEATAEPASSLTRCTERAVSMFISAMVQDAYLKAETPLELHYILPFLSVKTGRAGQLFDKLDENLRKLHLTGYGVTDTSLEEVFLKVTAYAKNEVVNGSDNNQALLNGAVSRKACGRRRSSPGLQRSFSEDLQGHGDPTQLEDSLGRVYTADPIARTQLRSSDHSLGGRQRKGSMRDKTRQPSTTEVPVRVRAMSWDVAATAHLTQENELRRFSDTEDPQPPGTGRHVVSGCSLWMHQFETSLYKRLIMTGRNWKALFSQIALPALFVVIAMVLGIIGGPNVQDEPALELSTAQYLNATKSRANHYVPFSDHGSYLWSYHAMPDDLGLTFKLPSGVGATCVLTSPDMDSNVTQYGESCSKVLFFDSDPQAAHTLEGYDPYAPLNGTTPPDVPEDVSSHYYPECQCTLDNRALICGDQPYSMAPAFHVITSDVMVNVTGQNESAYFYYTANDFRMSRYGATTFGHERRHVPYWLVTLQDQLKYLYVTRVAKAWYDSRGWHAMPSVVNAINNAILRANLMANKSFTGNPAAYGITVINHPMAGVGFSSASSLIFGAEMIIAIMMLVGFAFIPAGFLVFLVQERASNAKHLQFVSGLNPLVYWLSNLVWDWLVYLLPTAFCAMVLAAFQLPAFTEGQNYYATCLLLLVFGWGTTPTMYPTSFVFKDASTAYVVMACFHIFTGCSCLFVTFMLDYMGGTEELVFVGQTLKQVFLLFPGYALGRGLMDIVLTKTLNEVNAMLPDSHGKVAIIGPFDWEVTGRNMVCLAGVGAFFYLLTILIEYNFFVKPRVMTTDDMPEVGKEDPDVARERRRVRTGGAAEAMVKMENLTKIYKTVKLGKMLAVQRLSLGIPKGECFGMLGVNGAGKTSTFKMLTGDHPASGGDATIAGYSILSDMNHVRRNIGYCPQFDALFEELTARQHLRLYSLLRGIPRADVHQVVDWALKKLELTEYADRPSGTYSGGNRRKLSTAIALIGDPPVVFLDEPTAGMDPYAKRFLWDLVLNLVEEGKCVILTSHSMEECETLCTRLAIMVQGRFRCLGSVQHLKSRFGDGYNIKITVKGPDYNGDLTQLSKYLGSNLPNANLKERHFNMVEYELPPEHVHLSEIFSKMERARGELNVEDYSVCQNTLDNVFINFVNEQNKLLNDGTAGKRRRRSTQQEDLPLLGTRPSMRPDGVQNEAFVMEDEGPRGRIHSFVSEDLNIDELEAHGTSIQLNTPV